MVYLSEVSWKPLYNHLILEGYGRVSRFEYDNFNVDPKPLVLVLGRWKHPNTGNLLVGGINLNYLNDDEIIALRKALPHILRVGRRLKDRYWKGRASVPSVFENFYRTYNSNYIGVISLGTLRFWSDRIEKRKKRKPGIFPGREYDVKSDMEQLKKAARERRSKDIAAAEKEAQEVGVDKPTDAEAPLQEPAETEPKPEPGKTSIQRRREPTPEPEAEEPEAEEPEDDDLIPDILDDLYD